MVEPALRFAVGLDGEPADAGQRERLLVYNEDDVLATWTLRRWMSSPDVLDVPYAGDLVGVAAQPAQPAQPV